MFDVTICSSVEQLNKNDNELLFYLSIKYNYLVEHVFTLGRNNQEVQKGIIPNKARAEELATAQFNATKKELTASESRGSFFRRRRNSHRRSKSLSKVSFYHI